MTPPKEDGRREQALLEEPGPRLASMSLNEAWRSGWDAAERLHHQTKLHGEEIAGGAGRLAWKARVCDGGSADLLRAFALRAEDADALDAELSVAREALELISKKVPCPRRMCHPPCAGCLADQAIAPRPSARCYHAIASPGSKCAECAPQPSTVEPATRCCFCERPSETVSCALCVAARWDPEMDGPPPTVLFQAMGILRDLVKGESHEAFDDVQERAREMVAQFDQDFASPTKPTAEPCDCTPGTETCGRSDCTRPYAKPTVEPAREPAHQRFDRMDHGFAKAKEAATKPTAEETKQERGMRRLQALSDKGPEWPSSMLAQSSTTEPTAEEKPEPHRARHSIKDYWCPAGVCETCCATCFRCDHDGHEGTCPQGLRARAEAAEKSLGTANGLLRNGPVGGLHADDKYGPCLCSSCKWFREVRAHLSLKGAK